VSIGAPSHWAARLHAFGARVRATELLFVLVAVVIGMGAGLLTVLQGALARTVQHLLYRMPGPMRLSGMPQLAWWQLLILPVGGCVLVGFNRLVGAQRRALVDTVTGSDAAAALDGMSWREFELLVGESFRRQGWQVVEQGGAQADGGVDLILRRDRETFVVQCKQWKAFKVGVGVVRDLYGVMAARGAAGGFVVTSGRFTAEARRSAAPRP